MLSHDIGKGCRASSARVGGLSKARLIITAVVLEGRSQAQVARDYRVSQAWVSRLVARYRAEGDAAFEPRSRRPRTRPDATPAPIVELVLALRRQLTRDGLDAGAVTLRVAGHLHHIGVGRTLDGTRIVLLIDGYNVRILHAATGEIIRTLTIDPERRYHRTGTPVGGPRRPYGPRRNKKSEPRWGFGDQRSPVPLQP